MIVKDKKQCPSCLTCSWHNHLQLLVLILLNLFLVDSRINTCKNIKSLSGIKKKA